VGAVDTAPLPHWARAPGSDTDTRLARLCCFPPHLGGALRSLTERRIASPRPVTIGTRDQPREARLPRLKRTSSQWKISRRPEILLFYGVAHNWTPLPSRPFALLIIDRRSANRLLLSIAPNHPLKTLLPLDYHCSLVLEKHVSTKQNYHSDPLNCACFIPFCFCNPPTHICSISTISWTHLSTNTLLCPYHHASTYSPANY
jgi:hypothetical protein